MWRLIANSLDRLAMRSACGSVLPSPDGQSHANEAAAFLKRPDFFTPEVGPADVQLDEQHHRFQFASPFQSEVPENNLVRGKFDLAGADWRTRPSVILLHGWNAELQYQLQLPGWSRQLARAGVNAFRFELPYHGSRRPSAAGTIRNFFSGNLLHVATATHQALAETRALALWLRAQGSPTVGIWGVSLGAWLAGLATAHQAEFDLGVLLTPVARMDRALEELPFCAAIRSSLQGVSGSFPPLNLISHPARLPRGRLLVVDAELDLFVTRETVNELVAAHGAELWRVRHGHISVLFSGKLMRRIGRWIAEKTAAAPFDTRACGA
jgi:dienelactone hydrolase